MAVSAASPVPPQAFVERGVSANATPGLSSDHGNAASMSMTRMFASRAKRYSGSLGSAFVTEMTAAAPANVAASVSVRRWM